MTARAGRRLVAAALAGSLSAACQAGIPPLPDDPARFTIVVLPDTQYYSLMYPDTFRAQTRWIVDQRESLNIVAVAHLGDITERNSRAEWWVAADAMSALDGLVPYTVLGGNHDGIRFGKIDSQRMNQAFPVAKFAAEPWFGGHFGDTIDNNYILVSAGGHELMILSLSFGTPVEVLEWANQVVAAHPDRRVIVATHAYLDRDGTRLNRGHDLAVQHERWTDGDAIWDLLIRRHPNIFMVLCGHITGGAHRLSRGDHGNPVHEILSSFQDEGQGGDGYLRFMTFSPREKKIYVRTFSPVTGRFRAGNHSFEIDF